jgi:hypothetical protein
VLGPFRLRLAVLCFILVQGCALRGLTVFETIDASASAVSSGEAGVAVCIDDPDASGEPGVCTPGCRGVLHGHAYMICSVQAPWSVAESDCEKHGMQLVRVDDADENQWIHDAAFSFGVDRSWLGGSDLGAAGDWRWADGTQFWSGHASGMSVGRLYTNWDSGEPNDMGDVEHCVVMFDKTTWNDDDCFVSHRYVCEGR